MAIAPVRIAHTGAAAKSYSTSPFVSMQYLYQ